MPVNYQPGGDLSSGNKYLEQEGWFHCIVSSATDQPMKHSGELIAEALFGVEFEVLTGTVDGQKGKTLNETYFPPKETAKDGGAFGRRKIDKLLFALGMATKAQIEAKQPIAFEPADMAGRQLVIRTELTPSKNNPAKMFCGISFDNTLHVDDPEVATVPKDAESLAIIPPSMRRLANGDPAGTQAQSSTSPEDAPFDI